MCHKMLDLDIIRIEYGLPQGYILLAIPFLLHIDDSTNLEFILMFLLYADNTNNLHKIYFQEFI